ncbi:MAG: RNA-binding protein [Roseovarius sp.]|nr:RNA-binding protein [Roseovarius sp.]MCY4292503.1 RNA-binding protein [Roseovarius sp.]MCY4315457.1 RNA-binding protein [Roseovarius sp.]
MGRGGKRRDRSTGPERRCIAKRRSCPVSELLRFVVDPDGRIVPDIAGKLPGRGIWVSAERAAIEKAVSKRLFSRVSRQSVSVPEDLAEIVDRLLARRVVQLISLARKGGMAVAGYERVRDWLVSERAKVLIQASDGSTRGKSKLGTPRDGSWIGWVTSDELGQAFGRPGVVHAALSAGSLCESVVSEASRLKGLRVGRGDWPL